MNSGAPEGLTVPAVLVAPVVVDTAERNEHYLIWKYWGHLKQITLIKQELC